MNGPGKYDSVVTEVRERLNAAGVLMMVIDGPEGHGMSVQGTLAGNMEMADMLEQMASQLRKDTITAAHAAAKEAGLADGPELSSEIPDREKPQSPDDQSYTPMPRENLLAVSWEIMGYVQAKTGTWDEGLHALAFAIGGMRAAREAFAEDDNPDYAKNRVNEVLDFVLKEMTLIAYEGGPGEEPGIKASDQRPPRMRN